MAFTQHEWNGVVFHRATPLCADDGVLHGFSSRLGGVSEQPFSSLNLGRSRGDSEERVRENYRRFAQAVGGSLQRLILCRQVHSDHVVLVTAADALSDLYAPTPLEADGLITNVPHVALLVFYADCIPVLLYDPVRRAVGAVHSGWRGTAKGIAGKAVRLMGEHFGSRPTDLKAAIGPGICPNCFETHADVPIALREQFGSEAEAFIQARPRGKFSVDLKGMIAHTLRAQGLLADNIDKTDLCTSCRPELYWSHRRLGEARGNQAAVIALR